MSQKEEPSIEPYQGENFTKVTFYPDLPRFKMEELEADMVSLMTKRAYDLAGITDPKIGVILNGERIAIRNFPDYCDLYLGNEEN